MNERYLSCKEKVRKRVLQENAFDSDDKVRKLIFEVLSEENRKSSIRLRQRVQLGKRIFDALRRLDVLQPLMEDTAVTDIMVNGADHIYYERNGQMLRYEEAFESQRRLEDLIQQIVGSVNRSVNEASPIADARLADGSRVHVVLPPVALNGPVLTIRRFREKPITMRELIQWGTVTEALAQFLQKAVRDKQNMFVCGGTASGKTTLLGVLANCIPRQERIITIEDAAELRLSELDNVVTLETRDKNAEGGGQITMRDLIRASLRMNPDRIIVGEVRGAEALDMLQAMNTGHEGSLSTGHANSCRDMLMRIETMVLMGSDMPLAAIRQQIASALDWLIFIEKRKGGHRRVTEIVRVKGMEGDRIQTETKWTWKGEEAQWM